MHKQNPVMAILARETEQEFAQQIAKTLGYPSADVVIGTPREAVTALSSRGGSPRYLIIDVGDRENDVLPEIDMVAEYCEAETRVVVIGSVNDVNFYRELRSRGVIEYFTRPAKLADVRAALLSDENVANEGKGKVITFMSAASGDGASTIALNTAYALATEFRKSVVIVDMDYQFGMVAKNLDLTAPFGIKEIFEHPDRGVDSNLIGRMTIPYNNSALKIIASPNQLFPFPEVHPEVIRSLIAVLRREYDIVVIDLPHLWTPWIASALTQANHTVIAAQLWLRSVTHSARLLSAWRNVGIDNNQISLVVNRSGAKFKEAVSMRDIEHICAVPIRHYFVNDIKSVVTAENQGKTLLESGNSVLSKQFKEFAGYFAKDLGAEGSAESAAGPAKSRLSNLFGKT